MTEQSSLSSGKNDRSTSVFMRLRSTLLSIGFYDHDSGSVKQRKRLLMVLGVLLCIGAAVWGASLILLGLFTLSWIPFGYIMGTIINFSIFSKTKSLKYASPVQLLMSLILPFCLQWGLGGMLASGLVMLWSPVAILGALILQAGKKMTPWVILFFLLLLVSGVFDSYLQQFRPPVMTKPLATGLLIFNVSVMVILITAVSVRNFKRDRETRLKLYEAMEELKASKEELSAQGELLSEKSKTLENQNEQILSGLRYASRIQNAILPKTDDMDCFFSSCLVLYKPKDIVSGDFYWCADLEDRFVLVVADCTGHGVPGAFLTMLGSSILNQLVNENGTVEANKIMHGIDRQLAAYLKQNKGSDATISDGMDAAVVVFWKDKSVLEFAGSKQSLWMMEGSTLKEVKGDRYPVGHNSRYQEKEWKNHRMIYTDGDRFFLSTDGYKDQFGGPKNQKYMGKRLKQFIQDRANQPLDAVLADLDQEFTQWKAGRNQIDDVLVVGMEI